MGLAMRPVVIAKLVGLTLFGLYLALGFTHSTNDGAASKACASPPSNPIFAERKGGHRAGSSRRALVSIFRHRETAPVREPMRARSCAN